MLIIQQMSTGKEHTMKKLVLLLAATATLAAAPVLAGDAAFGVNISVGIPFPPVEVLQPPTVVAYPGPAYVVPVAPVFVGNRYYRSVGGRWYCGIGHDGPWRPIGYRHLPWQLHRYPGWHDGYPRGAWNRGDDHGRGQHQGWQPRNQQMAGNHDHRDGAGEYRGRGNDRRGRGDRR